ncbi:MAG: hypothetical protein L0Y72_31075 [Gemmataceae bacterium]|nr:hypothetical protein [Gemmataceae bacterium]MCI0743493.1 hypothetical protein [Gemmataceae bacterium]
MILAAEALLDCRDIPDPAIPFVQNAVAGLVEHGNFNLAAERTYLCTVILDEDCFVHPTALDVVGWRESAENDQRRDKMPNAQHGNSLSPMCSMQL